jgi:CRISPR/Cas system-associated endoribonuclease Cas2
MDDDSTGCLCAAHHAILRGHDQVPFCNFQKMNYNDTQFLTTQQAVCAGCAARLAQSAEGSESALTSECARIIEGVQRRCYMLKRRIRAMQAAVLLSHAVVGRAEPRATSSSSGSRMQCFDHEVIAKAPRASKSASFLRSSGIWVQQSQFALTLQREPYLLLDVLHVKILIWCDPCARVRCSLEQVRRVISST